MGLDGMAVYDCRIPLEPKLIKKWTGEEFCHPLWMAASGDNFFIADRFRGVLVVDFKDPQNPKIVNVVPVEGIATSLTLQGNLLSVACGGGGVDIFDVQNAAEPQSIYRFSDRIDYVRGACNVNDVVYLADNLEGGFKVLRMEDGGLKFQRQFTNTQHCDDVRVIGERAYVRFRSNGVMTYNIANPVSPVLISQVAVQNDAPTDFLIKDRLLLVTFKYFGLAAFDISTEDKPEFLGSYSLGELSESICLVGDYIYVANVKKGISIFEISPNSKI